MPDPYIEKLLILQDRDTRYNSIINQINSIPADIENFQLKIQKEKEALQAAKNSFKEIEVRRKELDIEIGANEEKLVKYKTQQMQVKKNEEYQALQHEIDKLTEIISDIEDKEIALLIEVDEKKEELSKKENDSIQLIKDLEQSIEKLHSHHEEFKSDLASAKEAVQKAETETDDKFLKIYHFVKKQIKKTPYIVPIDDQRCGGCFLRVSNEVEIDSKKIGEIHRCDSCGRIVFHN